MCRRIDCRKCGRPTYAGCGMHVEQVLGNVPPAARCQCRDEKSKVADATGAGGLRSWLRSLIEK